MSKQFAHEIKFPTESTYWVFYDEEGNHHIGVTEPDQVTVTGQPLAVMNIDDVAFLTTTESMNIDAQELPDEGKDVEPGVYSKNGKLFIVKDKHKRKGALDVNTPLPSVDRILKP